MQLSPSRSPWHSHSVEQPYSLILCAVLPIPTTTHIHTPHTTAHSNTHTLHFYTYTPALEDTKEDTDNFKARTRGRRRETDVVCDGRVSTPVEEKANGVGLAIVGSVIEWRGALPPMCQEQEAGE